MKMNMQSVGFTASSQLLEFTEQKLGKLVRFEDDISNADVYFRVENSVDSRKLVEIKLLVRGDELFASKAGSSFEEAVDESVDALRRQLLKRKGKIRG